MAGPHAYALFMPTKEKGRSGAVPASPCEIIMSDS
jgi:hypothetical protein